MTQAQPFDPIEFKQKTRREWHDAAAGWRKWHHIVEGEAGGQRHSATLVELVRVRPGFSVLDVGGGYGEPSLAAARVVGSAGRVVCTDISAEMLAFARERAREAGLDNIEFIESDAEELDFEKESFDAVVSRATIMFLPDVPGTLARLHSFLKPGGRFAASVWGEPSEVQFATVASVISRELALPPPLRVVRAPSRWLTRAGWRRWLGRPVFGMLRPEPSPSFSRPTHPSNTRSSSATWRRSSPPS